MAVRDIYIRSSVRRLALAYLRMRVEVLMLIGMHAMGGIASEGRHRRLRTHSRRGFRKFNPFSALSWCYCTVARPETGRRSAS